jgi:hypothetical protein
MPANASGIEEYDGVHYVVLHNVNGLLAVYEVLKDDHLRFVSEDEYAAGLKESWSFESAT